MTGRERTWRRQALGRRPSGGAEATGGGCGHSRWGAQFGGLLLMAAWLGLPTVAAAERGTAGGGAAREAATATPELAAVIARAKAQEKVLRERRTTAGAEAVTEAFRNSEILALRAIESELVDALHADPESLEAAEEVRQFYGWWMVLDSPAAGMLDLIARSADPPALAVRLAGRSAIEYHSQSERLLLAALAVRPGAAPLWLYAAQAAGWRRAWQLAFLEQSFRIVAPPGSTPRPELVPVAVAIAESWLAIEMEAGLTTRALAVWRGLPPVVRAAVEDGATGKVEAKVGGVPFTGELRDLRLDLAAAAALGGNRAEARRLVTAVTATAAAGTAEKPAAAAAAAPAPAGATAQGARAAAAASGRQGGGRQAAPAPSPREIKRRLLDRWLEAPRDDPFALFVEALEVEGNATGPDSLDAAGWQLVLARSAEREAYPEIAAYVLAALGQRLAGDGFDDELAGTGRGLPPAVLMGARGAGADLDRLHREVEEDARLARARIRTALGPDPAAPTIARLLALPLPAPFEERPLPERLQAGQGGQAAVPRAGTPQGGGGGQAMAPPAAAPASALAPAPASASAPESGRAAAWRRMEQLRLPAGFQAVRTERQGKCAAVIAISQAYDRQSPVSDGGYWVLLSDEKGTTWRRPLYTGLRANLPYTVRASSALPLLAKGGAGGTAACPPWTCGLAQGGVGGTAACPPSTCGLTGDHLQVEVEVREINSFFTTEDGPAELAPRQPRRGIYLDIPLAALERDADGDGLTDLEEQRLLLDPDDADTDHDGLGDAVDPMPAIAAVENPSPWAGPAAAILGYLADKGPPRQPSQPRRGWPGACCNPAPAAASSPLSRTVFVMGERPWFAGLRPAYRLIVLTGEEIEALRRKVTTPQLFGIQLLVLDRSGDRAFAVWWGELQGGKLVLERRGDSWHADSVSEWIS
jgi:hypothetical protein